MTCRIVDGGFDWAAVVQMVVGDMPTMMSPSVASSLPLAEISLRLPCGPYWRASVPDCVQAVFHVM